MNEKLKQVFDAGDIIKKVDDLLPYLQFINNACLVEFIKQSFEDARKYDSFFLHKKDGEVKELCGVLDRYPYSTKYAYRFTHASNNIQETPLRLSILCLI
jgi:hypothetical protein